MKLLMLEKWMPYIVVGKAPQLLSWEKAIWFIDWLYCKAYLYIHSEIKEHLCINKFINVHVKEQEWKLSLRKKKRANEWKLSLRKIERNYNKEKLKFDTTLFLCLCLFIYFESSPTKVSPSCL